MRGSPSLSVPQQVLSAEDDGGRRRDADRRQAEKERYPDQRGYDKTLNHGDRMPREMTSKAVHSLAARPQALRRV
jgi:hypothetical protein